MDRDLCLSRRPFQWQRMIPGGHQRRRFGRSGMVRRSVPINCSACGSFVDNGYQTEVFTYDSSLRVPEWVTRRDAREILPTDRVFHYQSGFGSGSPSLHSNLFRYLMLKTLGGWWFDLDILLLTAKVPQGDFLFLRCTARWTCLRQRTEIAPAAPNTGGGRRASEDWRRKRCGLGRDRSTALDKSGQKARSRQTGIAGLCGVSSRRDRGGQAF
jgi:hypothetical protein